MIRLLIISAVSGLVVGAICLASAFALGGRDIAKGGWKVPAGLVVNWEDHDDRNEEIVDDWAAMNGSQEVRDVAWGGSTEIDVGFPADVVYTQGPTPKIVVVGPGPTASRFYVEGDQIRLRGWDPSNTFTAPPTEDQVDPKNRPPRLRIEITSPNTSEFRLSGTESLEIRDYDQPSLTVKMSGASKVKGAGKAHELKIHASGAAEADLGALKADEADVELSGVARADVAASQQADLKASGAARINMVGGSPSQLQVSTSGIARVDNVPATPEAPMPPAKTETAAKSKR